MSAAVFGMSRHCWGPGVLTGTSWSICRHWRSGRRYLRFTCRSWDWLDRSQNTRQIWLICRQAWVVWTCLLHINAVSETRIAFAIARLTWR